MFAETDTAAALNSKELYFQVFLFTIFLLTKMNEKVEMQNISNIQLSQIHQMSGSPAIQKCQTFEKKELPRIPPKAGWLGKKLKDQLLADETSRKRVEGKRRGGGIAQSNKLATRVLIFFT